MHYLYHMVPKNMMGTALIPLNEMQKDFPELFQTYFSKYEGREFVVNKVIPKLDCKWNDVVFLCPLEPSLFYQGLIAAGHSPNPHVKFYKIPLNKLKEDQTIIYKYSREYVEMLEEEVEYLSFSNYSPPQKLSEDTLNWYKRCYEEKRSPLLFHRVPHIMTKSRVDIRDCEIIEWGKRN